MFTAGNSKAMFLDRKTMLLVREASDLLRDQEHLLDTAMSKGDMLLYETRAQHIYELLEQLSENAYVLS